VPLCAAQSRLLATSHLFSRGVGCELRVDAPCGPVGMVLPATPRLIFSCFTGHSAGGEVGSGPTQLTSAWLLGAVLACSRSFARKYFRCQSEVSREWFNRMAQLRAKACAQKSWKSHHPHEAAVGARAREPQLSMRPEGRYLG